jgi:hypothetical protein
MNTMHLLNKTEKDEAEFDARKELELKVRNDFVNHWSEVYKGEYDYLATLVGRTPFLKLMSLQSRQKAILELFQSENVVKRGYLKSMGIK